MPLRRSTPFPALRLALPSPASAASSPRRARPRRALALCGALLLGAVLTGCGEESADDGPSTPAPTIAIRRAEPQELPSAVVAAPEPEAEPSPSAAGPDASAPEQEPPTRTQVHVIWPDESWEIADLPGDACAGSLPTATDRALGEDFFRCGSADKRLLVCRAVEGGESDEALCVRDPLTRTAARIRSTMLVGYTAHASEMPHPLVVVLADGTQCGAVPRDDVEHHAGRQSWIHCGESAALLLDQSTATAYFDREEPVWTAELEMHGSEPRRVAVREVLYAGTPEDLREWGFTVGLAADGTT